MTKQIMVMSGGVPVGGGAPVSIQSMCNTFTHDVDATVQQIDRLAAAGCDIVRVAVPDMAAAKAIGKIKERISIPLVVDIHFDYRLALEAIAAGADKVRINPGNIGGRTGSRQGCGQCLCQSRHFHPHRRQRRQLRKASAGQVRKGVPGGAGGVRLWAYRSAE